MPKWLIFTICSAVLWGVWGFVSKITADRISPWMMQLLFTIGLIPPVLVALLKRGSNLKQADRNGVLFGFLAGFVGSLGNLALFAAYHSGGKASVVTAFTALYPLPTIILAILLLKEKPAPLQFLGIPLALAAILIFSWDSALISDVRNLGLGALGSSWLGYSLVAFFFWGFTGIAQKISTNKITAEASFLSFAAAFVPVGLVLLPFGAWQSGLALPVLALGMLGGILNGFGSLTSFAAYSSGGKASIVTPLAALYPVVTVLLAVLFLNEGLGLRECLGLLCAIAAGVALSL